MEHSACYIVSAWEVSPAVIFLVLVVIVLGWVDTRNHVTCPHACKHTPMGKPERCAPRPKPAAEDRRMQVAVTAGSRVDTWSLDKYIRRAEVCVHEAQMIGLFISFAL